MTGNKTYRKIGVIEFGEATDDQGTHGPYCHIDIDADALSREKMVVLMAMVHWDLSQITKLMLEAFGPESKKMFASALAYYTAGMGKKPEFRINGGKPFSLHPNGD